MTNTWRSLILGTLLTSLTACSGGGGGGGASTGGGTTNTSVTVEGAFSGLSVASVKPLFSVDIVTLSNSYAVYCQPMVFGANTSYGGPVAADGSFSFSATFPKGAAIGCILTNNDSIAAIFSFKRTQNTAGQTSDVNGYAIKEDTTSLDFGALTVSGGSVVVEPTNIVDNGTTASSNVITDITGAWTISSVYENEDEGYIHPCVMDELEGAELAACKSQTWAGIYLNMYKFTKSGQDDRYGMSIWQSETDFNSCSKAEGYTSLGAGWSIATGFNSNGTTVDDAFPAASIDLSSLASGGATLTKAPFRFYSGTGVDGMGNSYFYTNCPIFDQGNGATLADVPAKCTNGTVTTCGGFTDADWETGLTGTAAEKGLRVSQRKVMCILNTLTSGGASGYNWGSGVCGKRMKNTFWDSAYSSGDNEGFGSDNMKNDGTGCNNATCTGTNSSTSNPIVGINPYFSTEPKNRLLQGEVFLNGNVASGSMSEDRPTEEVNGHVCPVVANFSYAFTKTGANTMTIQVENIMVKGPNWGTGGNGTDAECLGTAGSPTWMGEEIGVARKIKMSLTK